MNAEEKAVFASFDTVIEGWYWGLRSDELKAGQARALNLMGRELVLYRGENGAVSAMDAYCSHMGAHLGEGWVQGDSIRCVFHYWKYGPDGACTEAPCFTGKPPASVRQKTFPVEEKYGLIWIWAGKAPRYPVPCPPELEGQELDFRMGRAFRKNCHPHVLLINAIDENHFASVHHLPFPLHMEAETLSQNAIEFRNTTTWPTDWWFPRWIGRLYRGAATYKLTYWNASTGAVTLGPDFLHFYILFVLRPSAKGDGRIRGEAIRPNPKGFLGYLWSAATFAFEPSVGDGGTEGWPIVVTKKRKGLFGRLFNRVVLFVTGVVGQYFAAGDSWVFRSIRFRLKTPVKADHAILEFIRHAEAQPVARDWTDDEASPAPGVVHVPVEEASPR
ncbi:MAG: aromatic ring-hydroxylating dioxygenase subunit alpha [Elusimicrobia bacterium]|nr:aromatic ring-hydroxylating dioxygenase subunit alpha [Elusimicrobiota bacterium]